MGQKVGYDLYRSIFKDQNIWFSKPSQGDTWKIYKTHSNSDVNSSCTSKICIYYYDHVMFGTEARQLYQADKAKKVLSIDMQKVLLVQSRPKC